MLIVNRSFQLSVSYAADALLRQPGRSVREQTSARFVPSRSNRRLWTDLNLTAGASAWLLNENIARRTPCGHTSLAEKVMSALRQNYHLASSFLNWRRTADLFDRLTGADKTVLMSARR